MEIPKEVTEILKGKPIEDLAIKVLYKNWRGEEGLRKIIPLQVYFGSTEFHLIDQWLLKVWDCEKNDYRTYAFKDIKQTYDKNIKK